MRKFLTLLLLSSFALVSQPLLASTIVYTVTTLQVLEDLTGRPGDRVEVWEMGGVIGDSAEYVGGQVRYELGREVVVCLSRGPQGLRSVAMGFSKFDVRRSIAGDDALARNLRETLVVGAQPRRVPAACGAGDRPSLTPRAAGRSGPGSGCRSSVHAARELQVGGS